MTAPTRAAKARRGSRRPGWALLTALLVLAIGSGIALIFTDKAIYLRIGLLLALWAAVIASFAALTYRRQSDADQVKVRDQKLVYDLQLEREISARREYELTVESRLRQQLASEIEAQATDEVAALRAELAALRTNLEILFNTDLGGRPALEHDPIRALGSWPGARTEPVAPVAAEFARPIGETEPESADRYRDAGYQAVATEVVGEVAEEEIAQEVPAEFSTDFPREVPREVVEEDTRTTENPIIDVSEDPNHVEDDATPTPPYPTPAYQPGYDTALPPEPASYQQPAAGWTLDSPVAQESATKSYWSARAEDWDAAADGDDWDPVPEPMAPPEQPAPSAASPSWKAPSPPVGWRPAPAEGQWLPPGSAGSHWAPSQPDPVPLPPVPSPFGTAQTTGRHSGPASWPQTPPAVEHQAPAADYPRGRANADVPHPDTFHADAPHLDAPHFGAPGSDVPPAHAEPARGHRAEEQEPPGGRRRSDETGGYSVADLLGRLQADSDESGGGRRRRRED